MIFHTDQLPDRLARTSEGDFLYFSGTAYLGIPHDAHFRTLLGEGMARYGSNYGSSRSGNLRLRVYEEAEAHLQQWTGSPAALLMSSGFLAGQLLVHWLRQNWATAADTAILYAPDTHPAVWSGHETASDLGFAEWVGHTVPEINASSRQRFIIVSNSVDSIRGQLYDFHWLQDLSADKEIILIADDSHGFGLLGSTGGGIYAQLPDLPNVQRIVIASMAKACGIPAGMVLGPPHLLASLRATPFYAGASPTAPAYLYAFARAGEIYRHNLALLRANTARFADQTAELGLFHSSPGYPVFFTRHNALYQHLLTHRLLVSSFPYPKADAPPITRVVINCRHTEADLAQLAGALGQWVANARFLV